MTRRDLSPHPCIVNSLEVGRHFLTPYEIIEYVDGVPLRNLMTLDARRVRDDAEFILREMAQGLAWVHTCGMMHLDVKPENFLVKKQGDHFTVKLTDFDMARKKDDNGPRKILGTPGFMAPEQFNQKLSYQASDVFAFGLIAYQIVTCKLPFSGKTQKETWRQQASPNVQPRPIHELVPNVNQKQRDGVWLEEELVDSERQCGIFIRNPIHVKVIEEFPVGSFVFLRDCECGACHRLGDSEPPCDSPAAKAAGLALLG